MTFLLKKKDTLTVQDLKKNGKEQTNSKREIRSD